jgi:hypothetical protein
MCVTGVKYLTPQSTVHSTASKRTCTAANTNTDACVALASHSISSNLLDWLREGPSSAISHMNAGATHWEGKTSSSFSLSNYSASSTPYRGQLPQLQRSHQHPREETDNQGPARGGRRNNKVIVARGWQRVNYIQQKSSHSVSHPETQAAHAASSGPAAGKVGSKLGQS